MFAGSELIVSRREGEIGLQTIIAIFIELLFLLSFVGERKRIQIG